jgi:HK97 family phage portal protein
VRADQVQKLIGGGPISIKGTKQDFDLIPSWQAGFAQETEADYANLIAEGYTRHVVIHACISMLASSAAQPPFVVKDAEGEPVPTHPALGLLRRPNEHQSKTDLIIELITHLLVTGNAYLEIVRGPNGFGRPTALGLLRPDRVKIRPGAKREDDVFEQWIGGVIVSETLAADMIHFKLDNPASDFYGLSPLVTIAREANLDIDLTLFAKAFFEHAGVPFGMLVVSGKKLSKDEKKEVKLDWRNAFGKARNGVRRYFELLLLNSDDAKYETLGAPMSELEMPSTRNQTESRIAAGFRVPPIMVGAMVGLEHATYANFEAAEKVFWRYGVTHYLNLVLDRLDMRLMPEFVTTATATAKLGYDLAGVEALAEDNTEKLEAVGKLIAGGGFTVNEALQAVGMAPVPNGDFYVRPFSVVIVQKGEEMPALAPSANSSTASALTHLALKGAASRIPAVIQGASARIEPKLRADLAAHFEDESGEILRKLRRLLSELDAATLQAAGSSVVYDGKVIREGDLYPDGQDAKLEGVLRGHILAAEKSVWEAVTQALGTSIEYDETGPVARRLLNDSAKRVVEINNVTKKAIRETMALAEQRGYNLFQIANGVEADGFRGLRAVVKETYKGRADAIARTELGFATNDAALDRYTEAGIVEVEIIDGDDDAVCGSRNGTTVEISSARPSLAHPNCTLVVVPVIPDLVAAA